MVCLCIGVYVKKALISTIEPVHTGFRIAQVVDELDMFEVHESLFWVDCADVVTADIYYYDTTLTTILTTPVPMGNDPFAWASTPIPVTAL